MDNSPLPFPANRRPRPRLPQPDPDFHAAILERLALLSDQIDEIADMVIRDAARRGKAGGG